MISFKIFEKLDPRKHDIGDYIDDFMKSDAPQFKGKSKEKIRDMALAAYRAARKEAGLKEAMKESIDENRAVVYNPRMIRAFIKQVEKKFPKYKGEIQQAEDDEIVFPNDPKLIKFFKGAREVKFVLKDSVNEAVKFWTVTITKKAGKLFKGQTVDVKARNSAEAIKKGIKQMKGNPALVPGGSVTAKLDESIKEGAGLWANIHKKRKSGKRMRKPGEKGAPTAADFKRARGENVEEGKGPPESFEAQFKRRVVKTTKPEHKEKGYNWRIKGKDRPEISIKLYKEKPGFAEFKKQLRRVAGHEFG